MGITWGLWRFFWMVFLLNLGLSLGFLIIGESTKKTNGFGKRIKQYYDHKVGW